MITLDKSWALGKWVAGVGLALSFVYGAAADPLIAVPGSGQYVVHVISLKDLKYARMIKQQEDFSCGSAALATILTYHYDFPISEHRILEAMYAEGDQQKIRKEGFSMLDMKRYLAKLGYQADGFIAPLEKLVSTSTPAIVLVLENGYKHFVVIKGMREGRILVGDPARGTRVVSRKDFDKIRVNDLVFVIHGASLAAHFNTDKDWKAGPIAALSDGVNRDNLLTQTLLTHNPNDF